MKIKRASFKITLPPAVLPRVERVAEMRGLSVEDYIVSLVQIHSPAYDNDSQYLKSRIRKAIDDRSDDFTAVKAVLELVR